MCSVSEPFSPLSILPKSFDSANASPISRRDFGRRAVIGAAVTLSSALLACNIASVQESKPGEKSPDKSSRSLAPDQAQEVEARLANIVRKHGNRLSEEQRQHLRRILTYNERMLASIRTFSLQNGDPPASVLKISLRNQAEPAKRPSSPARQSARSLAGTQEDQA
jgi:hypothetical protein